MRLYRILNSFVLDDTVWLISDMTIFMYCSNVTLVAFRKKIPKIENLECGTLFKTICNEAKFAPHI